MWLFIESILYNSYTLIRIIVGVFKKLKTLGDIIDHQGDA